ncbi:WbqC family protein [Streptomyces sp. N50]|uniref:WbqC family protein n=1 Tax=Streptomyces sp. N50 TaxID=3081765 RepID=UPI0029621772|nr:WbqC family protein [Streptomyces sp. N50]WOX10247.1 WbqC family protein [Streptomyces sp. N50]
MPSTVSVSAATTAGSCLPDSAARPSTRPVGSCAIHQPNFLPRLSTLAKLYTADVWVVLDDVQFVRRDYQHRARLAALDDPQREQWLSVETHLPYGRATLIRDARLADPRRSARRLGQLPTQHYRASPYWQLLHASLEPVVRSLAESVGTAAVAEATTRALLNLLGWRGTIVRSSDLAASSDRSARLADLTTAVGADTYLCGTGGLRYLDHRPFAERQLNVHAFRPPTAAEDLWTGAARITALWALAAYGPSRVRAAFDGLRTA